MSDFRRSNIPRYIEGFVVVALQGGHPCHGYLVAIINLYSGGHCNDLR